MSIVADEARAGPVGVVVQPESWDADPGFLATVLAGLQGNPLVRPATVAQYFTEVPPAVGDDGQLVERSLAPSAPEDLTGYAADRTASQLGLAAFGSMVAPTSSLPAELPPAAAGLPGAGSVAAGPLGLPHCRRRAAERAPPVGRPGPGPHHHPRRAHDRAAHHPHQPGQGAVTGQGAAAQQQAGLPGGQRTPRHDHRRRRAPPGTDRGSDQRDVPRHHRRPHTDRRPGRRAQLTAHGALDGPERSRRRPSPSGRCWSSRCGGRVTCCPPVGPGGRR